MNEKQTHILGSKLDLLRPDQIDQLFSRWLSKRRLHHIVTLNPEICLYAESREGYRRQILNKADLTTRDGFGLAIGGFLLGTKTPARMTGMDVVLRLTKLAYKKKQSIYLIGGEEGVAMKAADRLRQLYPGVQIVGSEIGMSREDYEESNPDLVKRINKSGASILFVAFGAPKQEQWIAANREALSSVKIAVGVGGIFDYLANEVPTPLKIFKKLGLEWLFRLVTQRGRLKRVFQAVIVFPLLCLKWRLRILFVYRKNVVGVIENGRKDILLVSPWWAESVKWQFPQGGVDKGESADKAILREMREELGTTKLAIKQHFPKAYRYTWPEWYQLLRGYKGQDQDLFSLDFVGLNKDINIEEEGELRKWSWVPRKDVVKMLAPARKSIGKIALDLID